MDFGERTRLMWAGIIAFLPNLLGAILILLVGLVIAKLLEKATDALLERLHFDEALDRGGVNRALARAGAKLDPSSLVGRLVFWTIALVAILMASNALGLVAVSAMFYSLISYIPKVIVAVLIVIVGMVLGEFVKDLIAASMGGVSGFSVLGRAAKGAIVALALFMALDQLGVAADIVRTAFTLLLGAVALAAGLAFGLGCRDLAGEHMRRWIEQGRNKAEEIRLARQEAEERQRAGWRPPPLPHPAGMAASRLEGDSTIAIPPSPARRS
jgi:mechanosensitive ion channel-like protein